MLEYMPKYSCSMSLLLLRCRMRFFERCCSACSGDMTGCHVANATALQRLQTAQLMPAGHCRRRGVGWVRFYV